VAGTGEAAAEDGFSEQGKPGRAEPACLAAEDGKCAGRSVAGNCPAEDGGSVAGTCPAEDGASVAGKRCTCSRHWRIASQPCCSMHLCSCCVAAACSCLEGQPPTQSGDSVPSSLRCAGRSLSASRSSLRWSQRAVLNSSLSYMQALRNLNRMIV